MKFDPKLTLAQDEAVQYMLQPEREGACLLAWTMGLGKTRVGMMFARESGVRVVLASVPLQTVDGWIKDAGREYPDLPVYHINSTKEGKKALARFQWRQEGLYLVGHEYWERLAWRKEKIAKRRKTDPDKFRKVDSGVWAGGGYLFIMDESHRSANPDSWTFKALMNIEPDYKLSMSGTFFGDQFDGAYGATRWLWPHRTDIIPADRFSWRAQWAEVKYDPFAPRNQKVVGEKNPGAFVDSLPGYLRMETDLPDPESHELWVDLYPEQRRVYDELDEKLVAWVNDEPLVADMTAIKRVRQRQTTLAMPTLTFNGDGELTDVSFADDADSVKIDRLFQAIDGNDPELGDLMVGESVLILTDSQKFARLLTHRLNERYGDVAREWSGKITRPKRKIVKQQFIDKEIRFLVGVQAAMGTGTDGLQKASHIVVFMSRADRQIDNDQGIGRLLRMGQEVFPVHVIHIFARDTVDTGQYSKQLQDAIKRAKSLRRKKREEEENARKELLRSRNVRSAA